MNIFKLSCKVLISLIIFDLLLCSKEPHKTLLETKGSIKFSETQGYQVSLENTEKSKMIAIQILTPTIYNGNNEDQISIYTNLNNDPEPDKVYYYKKTSSPLEKEFSFENGVFNLYQIDYSPCDYRKNDTLYVKIVGIEGEVSYTLIVSQYEIDNLKIIHCGKGDQFNEEIATYTSAKDRIFKLTNDIEIFVLNQNEEEWEVVKIKLGNITKPGKRENNIFQYWNDKLYVYGGIDEKGLFYTDFWVFDLVKNTWFKVKLQEFQPIAYLGDSAITSEGKLVFLGKDYKTKENFIYQIDLPTVNDILFNLDKKKTKKLSYKIKAKQTKFINTNLLFTKTNLDLNPFSLCQYQKYNLVEIENNILLLFGGYDKDNSLCNDYSLIDLNNNRIITKKLSSSDPAPRAGASLIRIGTILFLFGGFNGIPLKDSWKYNIPQRTWTEISYWPAFPSTFQYNSDHSILPLYDKLVLISKTGTVLNLNFELCQSDTEILSNKACMPCNEGFSLNKTEGCSPCKPGHYFQYTSPHYSKGECSPCPAGSINRHGLGHGISSCFLCQYGSINRKPGMSSCELCDSDEDGEPDEKGGICLVGSNSKIPTSILSFNVATVKNIERDNFPDFTRGDDYYYIDRLLNGVFGYIIIFFVILSIVLVFFLLYKINSSSCNSFLITCDFLPLTGGAEKKTSGGLITLTYITLITIIFAIFMCKYFLWNQDYDISTIPSSSIQKRNINTMLISLAIIGSGIQCESKKVNIQSDYNLFNLSFTQKESICNIEIRARNFKDFLQFKDISLELNKGETQLYVKVIKANINLYWNELFEDEIDSNENDESGYSKIVGIFSGNSDISGNLTDALKTRFIIVPGKNETTFNYSVNPVLYKHKNTEMNGYRVNLNEFKVSNVKSVLPSSINSESNTENSSIKFKIHFEPDDNIIQVIGKKDFTELAFFVYFLGIVAGFAFLARLVKFLFEKCKVMDLTRKQYGILQEETQNTKTRPNVEDRENIEMGQPHFNDPSSRSSYPMDNINKKY